MGMRPINVQVVLIYDLADQILKTLLLVTYPPKEFLDIIPYIPRLPR
jgi:hypothetical protein